MTNTALWRWLFLFTRSAFRSPFHRLPHRIIPRQSRRRHSAARMNFLSATDFCADAKVRPLARSVSHASRRMAGRAFLWYTLETRDLCLKLFCPLRNGQQLLRIYVSFIPAIRKSIRWIFEKCLQKGLNWYYLYCFDLMDFAGDT